METSVLSEYGLYELSIRYVGNRGASRHLISNMACVGCGLYMKSYTEIRAEKTVVPYCKLRLAEVSIILIRLSWLTSLAPGS